MMKLALLITLLVIPSVNAEIFISEVNFIGGEFIEIFSNNSIDLESKRIFDEQGSSKFNTLTKVKDFNSTLILIIGSKFRESNSIDPLNCTVYQSDKSQVSNGGLKDTTESFAIEINSSFNLSFSKGENINFEEGQSLNILRDNNFLIENQSPCLINLTTKTTGGPNLSNENGSSNNESTNPPICNDSFNINLEDKDFFENKIEFSFDSSLSENFTIEYFVEDLKSNIVKEKRETTNKNKKSFTPKKKTEIFNIKANLKKDTCVYNSSKLVSFYSEFEEEQKSDSSKDKEEKIKVSHFKILNKAELTQLKTSTLDLEVYKGTDTTKKTILVYHNKKKINTFQATKKDKKTKHEIEINLSSGINKILVTGLDLEEEFYIMNNDEIKIEQNFIIEDEKDFFDITQILIDDEVVYFDIKHNFDDLDGNCILYYKRTKVSNQYNLTNSTLPINYLITNISKLKEKEKFDSFPLKLSCKYKKEYLKTFKYENEYFNFTLPKENKQITQLHNFTFLSNKDGQDNIIEKENRIQKESIFESKNLNLKTNSIYFSFSALVLLLGAFLFKVTI